MENEKLILEALRMLLWENHRKWESINLKHGGGGCVEINEIVDLVAKINDVLQKDGE